MDAIFSRYSTEFAYDIRVMSEKILFTFSHHPLTRSYDMSSCFVIRIYKWTVYT